MSENDRRVEYSTSNIVVDIDLNVDREVVVNISEDGVDSVPSFPTETVVCPNCNEANEVWDLIGGMSLSTPVFEETSCRACGYPLDEVTA